MLKHFSKEKSIQIFEFKEIPGEILRGKIYYRSTRQIDTSDLTIPREK